MTTISTEQDGATLVNVFTVEPVISGAAGVLGKSAFRPGSATNLAMMSRMRGGT